MSVKSETASLVGCRFMVQPTQAAECDRPLHREVRQRPGNSVNTDDPEDGSLCKPSASGVGMIRNEETLFPRTAEGLIAFHNAIIADRGFQLPPHMLWPAYALMDDRISKLLIIIGPGATKSTLISMSWPAFRIGHNPNETVLGISAGENLIQGFQNAVGEVIEGHRIWRTSFPGVGPDKPRGWSTDKGLFVTGRSLGDDNASYFACGLTSSALTGKHASIIICDDLHNQQNSNSSTACDAVWKQYFNTILGRSVAAGTKYVVTGRRWRGDDIYQRLIDTGEYVVMELPAEREGETELYWDVRIPDGLTCCFTEMMG